MTQYEYRTVEVATLAELNKFGRDGWRVAAATRTLQGNWYNILLVREVQP